MPNNKQIKIEITHNEWPIIYFGGCECLTWDVTFRSWGILLRMWEIILQGLYVMLLHNTQPLKNNVCPIARKYKYKLNTPNNILSTVMDSNAGLGTLCFLVGVLCFVSASFVCHLSAYSPTSEVYFQTKAFACVTCSIMSHLWSRMPHL